MDNVKDYMEWLRSAAVGRHSDPSPLSEAHQEIADVLKPLMLSLDEMVILFAGISSTYCKDATDAKVSVDLFDDTLSEAVFFKEPDVEIVNEVDEDDDDDLRW